MARTKKPVLAEVGSAGLSRTGGYISADFLPQLIGRQGIKAYTEMANNDPLIGAVLFAISMLIRNTEWRTEPKDESAKAKEYADFVQEELFEKMETSFADVLSEVSSMFTYGFAPMETVYTLRDDGKMGIRKIQLRSQETLDQWAYDTDDRELIGMWQQDLIRPRVLIPIEKLLLFRTQTTQGNPEGKSVLRTSYMTWMRKRAIEEAEGRAAMRAAGVVTVRIPGEFMSTTASPDQKAVFNAYKDMADKMAKDRQGACVLPSDVHPDTKALLYDIEYKVPEGAGKKSADMSPIVERYDKRMASTVLADFILLGQQAVGSFALSSDKTVLFSVALGAWLQVIAGVFKRQLMPRWFALNGWDEALMPELQPQDVETPNLTEMADYVTKLAAAGMPLFPDENLSAHLRQLANLPEASEETLAAHADIAENEAMMRDTQLEQATADVHMTKHPPKPIKKFAAGQPREPAGSPAGGQFAPAGGAQTPYSGPWASRWSFHPDIKEGSRVLYTDDDRQPPKPGTITNFDMKHGMPTAGVKLDEDAGSAREYWGYATEFNPHPKAK